MCNFVRFAFACVGAVVDAVAPLKPVFGHPLPNPTRDDGTDGSELGPCPGCGHRTAHFPDPCFVCYDPYQQSPVAMQGAVEDASPAGAPVPAGDVPHTIHRSPTFAVLQALLTEYAVDHGELRFDGTADHWSCQCGQVLPDGGDGAYAALRDHCIELQTSALSFAIAEARNTQK